MVNKLSFVGEKVSLAKLCKPKQWKTIPKTELKQCGYPVYGANGLIGYSDSYNHENPTILITCRGATCGEINICSSKSYVTGNAMCLDELSSLIILDYLAYYLKQYDFIANGIIGGSAQPQITKASLEKVLVKVIDLETQKQIVNRLSTIERNIEKCKNQLIKLDQLIKSRFVEMFGKEVEEKTDLNNLIKANSSISYGIVQPGSDGTGKLGVIRPVDIEDNILNYSNIKYIDPIIGERYKKTLLDGKEILLIVRGATGGVALTDERVAGMNVTRGIAVIRYDEQKIDPVFLLNYLKSDESQRFIANHTQGATLKQINLSDLRKQPILLPNFQRQKEFSVFAKQVDKLRFVAQQQIEKLQTLYDSLAQEYFGD